MSVLQLLLAHATTKKLTGKEQEAVGNQFIVPVRNQAMVQFKMLRKSHCTYTSPSAATASSLLKLQVLLLVVNPDQLIHRSNGLQSEGILVSAMVHLPHEGSFRSSTSV